MTRYINPRLRAYLFDRAAWRVAIVLLSVPLRILHALFRLFDGGSPPCACGRGPRCERPCPQTGETCPLCCDGCAADCEVGHPP